MEVVHAVQGRFSGRLETKDDERLLAEECKHVGALLGGVGKRGERARTTLAKIVRGIAAGDVRRFLESREVEMGVRSCHVRMLGLPQAPRAKPSPS